MFDNRVQRGSKKRCMSHEENKKKEGSGPAKSKLCQTYRVISVPPGRPGHLRRKDAWRRGAVSIER